MAGANFDLYLSVVIFLATIWLSGRISREFGISPIIGEIAAGVAVGPNALNLVPYVEDPNHGDDGHSDWMSVWVLLGSFGVTLMIVESGTHIHFKKLREVGMDSLQVAVIGTFLPLALGMGFFLIIGESVTTSFACGCALAPTSVGIALKLLGEANQLNSTPGQTIVTAAFLDDIFSLVLLVIVVNLKGTVTIWTIVTPFILCFLFLAYGVYTSARIMPRLIPWILSHVQEVQKKNYQPRDEVHLGLMVTFMILYGWIAHYLGSHLLGAFVAGMSFCEVPRSMYIWRNQMKRLSNWLVRLFFSSTVAFSIPVQQMFDFTSFWKGLILAILPTILAKCVAGVFVGKFRWVIGVAMIGRGEFAYLVAETLVKEKLVSEKVYAMLIWALLWAVLIGPILFKYVLKRAFRDKPKTGIKCFEINASGKHHNNIHFEIVDTLHHLQLDVLEATTETDGQVDICQFIVSCGDNDDLNEDMIAEIQHDIVEALNDPEAQVTLAPHDQEFANENKNIVEIRIMSQHHPAILPQILRLFSQLHLEVLKIHTEDHLDVDHDVFFCEVEQNFGPDLPDLAVVRYGLRDIFHQHNEKCEVMVRRCEKEKLHTVTENKRIRFGPSSPRSPETPISTREINLANAPAHHLLDPLGEGFEISFIMTGRVPTNVLMEICFYLSDLELDVTAVDLVQIESADNSVKGTISTRDILIYKGTIEPGDPKRKMEIDRRLRPVICSRCSQNRLWIRRTREEDYAGDADLHSDFHSPSTKANGSVRMRSVPRRSMMAQPRLTKRLTMIDTNGDIQQFAQNNSNDDGLMQLQSEKVMTNVRRKLQRLHSTST